MIFKIAFIKDYNEIEIWWTEKITYIIFYLLCEDFRKETNGRIQSFEHRGHISWNWTGKQCNNFHLVSAWCISSFLSSAHYKSCPCTSISRPPTNCRTWSVFSRKVRNFASACHVIYSYKFQKQKQHTVTKIPLTK